jgi:hypothetical protein
MTTESVNFIHEATKPIGAALGKKLVAITASELDSVIDSIELKFEDGFKVLISGPSLLIQPSLLP